MTIDHLLIGTKDAFTKDMLEVLEEMMSPAYYPEYEVFEFSLSAYQLFQNCRIKTLCYNLYIAQVAGHDIAIGRVRVKIL